MPFKSMIYPTSGHRYESVALLPFTMGIQSYRRNLLVPFIGAFECLISEMAG